MGNERVGIECDTCGEQFIILCNTKALRDAVDGWGTVLATRKSGRTCDSCVLILEGEVAPPAWVLAVARKAAGDARSNHEMEKDHR